MSSPSSRTGEGGGYPRICGQCGTTFVAVRGHARWCSDRCRLRAWRQRHSPGTRKENRNHDAALVEQVRTLQAALGQAQVNDVCAHHGCRREWTTAGRQLQRQGDHDAEVAPWRDPDWEHPVVQRLRTRVSEQAAELDRLREENGLLRRWVGERASLQVPGTAGE
jgi:hypothetical protein